MFPSSNLVVVEEQKNHPKQTKVINLQEEQLMGGSIQSADDPEKNTTMCQNLPVDRDNNPMQPDLALTPQNPHDHEDDETTPQKIAHRDSIPCMKDLAL
ncbi:unnamed protein product [Urochloa humidicola]